MFALQAFCGSALVTSGLYHWVTNTPLPGTPGVVELCFGVYVLAGLLGSRVQR